MNYHEQAAEGNDTWTTSRYLFAANPKMTDVAYEVDGCHQLRFISAGLPTRFRCNGHPGTDRTLSMRVNAPKIPSTSGGRSLHLEIYHVTILVTTGSETNRARTRRTTARDA